MASIPERSIEQLEAQLNALTLLQASELIKQIEEAFGVSRAAPIGGMMMVAPGETDPDERIEEQTEFDAVPQEMSVDKKIAILKIVREVTGLGLKEAKDVVESTPKAIYEGVSKDISEEAKIEEEVEAKVHIPGQEKELLDKFATLRDAGFVIKEVDNIFVELTRIDDRISQSQVGIDDLKISTREMLAALRESIV